MLVDLAGKDHYLGIMEDDSAWRHADIGVGVDLQPEAKLPPLQLGASLYKSSVASQTDVEIILWEGSCEVHERFTGDELRAYRAETPGIQIIER